MIIEEPEAVAAPIVINVAPPVLPPIGFSNALAVRTALFAGFLALAGMFVSSQIAQALAFPCLIAGGFLAVYLYEKRTGQRLSIASGARLGWLCGIFLFVVMAIMLAGMAAAISDPALVSSLRDQMKSQGMPQATVDQLITVFKSPSGLVSALLQAFLIATVLTAGGGALGDKLLGATSFRD
jgi:hypothetical protein